MAQKRVRPTETRLERVEEIIADDPNARQLFEITYQNCGVPLWLRSAMSTLIEKQQWRNVDTGQVQGLFDKFIAEAFNVVPYDENNSCICFKSVKDLKSRYQGHPEEFIQNMQMCEKMEQSILDSSAKIVPVVSVEEFTAEPSSSAEIATRAYHDLMITDIVGNNSKKQRTMHPLEPNLLLYEKKMQEVHEMFEKEVNTCLECRKQWQREDDSIHYKDASDLKDNSLDAVKHVFCLVNENFKKIKEFYDRVKDVYANLCAGKLDEAFQNISKLHQDVVDRSFVLEGLTKRIFSMEKKKHEDTFRIKIISLLGLGIRKIDSIGLYDRANKPMAKVKYEKFEVTQASLVGVSIVNFTRMKSQNCASEPCFLKIDVQATTGEDSPMKHFQIKSGPCLCASHTQVAKATGLLMWMLAFPSTEGCYHAEVDWKDFLAVLCSFWKRETERCTLSKENTECLAHYFGNPRGLDTFKISRSKVFEEKVPSQEKDKKKWFTMLEWFNGCINLVKEYPDLFQKRLIHGLVTKERARTMLAGSEKKNGAFLIRISQTFLDRKTKPYAGLSIVVQNWNKEERKYSFINGDMFSINHPGGEQGVLPEQRAFGRWLMTFAADSSSCDDSKKVYLSHLCGRTELVGETFGKYTYRHTTGSKNSDYVTFEQARFFDCRKTGQAIPREVSPGCYQQLMELISALHECCDIPPQKDPYYIGLQSPNSQSNTWKVSSSLQDDVDSGTTENKAAQLTLYVAVDSPDRCIGNGVHPEETAEYNDPRMESDMPCAVFPTQNGHSNSIGNSGPGQFIHVESSSDPRDLSPEEIVRILEDPNFKVIDCTQLSKHCTDALGDSALVGDGAMPVASDKRPDTLADIPQSSPGSHSTSNSPPHSVTHYQNKRSSKSNGQVVPSMSPLSNQSSPAESLSSQATCSSYAFSPNGRVLPDSIVSPSKGRVLPSPSMDALPKSVESMTLDMD